ncbi:unnamed protein product, partial [Mesorhabditis belari]|uniref:G-protein coupled receptors family 3 profile domain-containing protein n=1 Tax=Mesorhabditis belari TaxID=2138241 RepID=A0AAF3FI55_9BILA
MWSLVLIIGCLGVPLSSLSLSSSPLPSTTLSPLSSNDDDLCSVYDPFKVLPDNNKFQIGGSFPLHEEDCRELRPDTVQEIVAIQWALTHWNQNPNNFNAKLGLYAGDSCSRSREALSQSLRFLDSLGFLEPTECRNHAPPARLLGVIAPKDGHSSALLGRVVGKAALPVASYSLSSSTVLSHVHPENLISTTPTISVYVEVAIRVLAQLRSNLVILVDSGSDEKLTQDVTSQLKDAGIFIAEQISINSPLFIQTVTNSEATIVLSLLSVDQLSSLTVHSLVSSMDKLWLSLPLDGEALPDDQITEILPEDSTLQVMLIQPRFTELPQFRDYFLRVLKNNYQSYSLLTSYVNQVYNCTIDNCDLEEKTMIEKYAQSRHTEAAIRLAYAFSTLGAVISADPKKMKICEHADPECTSLLLSELSTLEYTFTSNDPAEFGGQSLHFYRGKDGVLVASGMVIEAIEVSRDKENRLVQYKLLEYTTGKKPSIVIASLRPQTARIRSICMPHRPFCGVCPNVVAVSAEKYFVSIPKTYPVYLSALFSLHSGLSCENMKNTDISLPMAFIHTVWTFKQRFPQLNLLKNLEFGALLVDTCASGKQAMECVIRSETQCFQFAQAERNITIVPKSIFGYVSALEGDAQQALRGYFASSDTDVALVSADPNVLDPNESFSALPSARAQAMAILRLLSRMNWEFVTVALSENDSASLSIFRHFERLAPDQGICLAEVINLSGDSPPAPISNTNVTIVFATAKDAASYLAAGHNQVHIMVGDAHDFYLHVEADRSKYVGTVSIQPKDIVYPDFREWLETVSPLNLPEMWFWSFIEDRYQCALSQKSKIIYGKMCTGDELLDVPKLGRMTRAGYLSRGIERLLFAMDAIYKKLCPTQSGFCPEFYSSGRKAISEQLRRAPVEDDVEMFEWMEGRDGRPAYHLIGNWSAHSGLRMTALYKPFGRSSPVTSKCVPPLCKCFLEGNFFQRPLDAFVQSGVVERDSSYVRKQPAFGADTVQYASILEHLSTGEWRAHPHNFVLLAVISLLTISALAVLILVLVKLYLRVVKGNQSLGISLLVGIIMLYITAYFFVFDATDMVCRARVILHGLAYTICFGVMIAKGTQLRNAETLYSATNVHISFWNYWLLLFFIFGVQIALSVRWAAEAFLSTWSISGNSTKMVCSYGRVEFVLSNAYAIILLILALFINSRNRNIKRNYKETKWLCVSSMICAFIWLLWIAAYFSVPYEWKESVIALELLMCATVLLAFLFGPKIYILLSYEPVVVEYKVDYNAPQGPKLELFENEEERNSPMRAVSPASSTGSWDKSSARGTGSISGSTSSRGARRGPHSANAGAHLSDDQSPIFHTVMRKKKAVRRTHSEHDSRKNVIHPRPDVPVIRAVAVRSPVDRMRSPVMMSNH